MEFDCLRDKLVAQYEENYGALSFAAAQLVDQYIFLEGLKAEAKKELLESGIRERYSVAKYQTGRRENKAIGVLLKLESQQIKILQSLKLLPSRKVKDEVEDDAGAADADGDINDY